MTRLRSPFPHAQPLPLLEYPRPQFVREGWTNLNGYWDYAIRPEGARRQAGMTGKLLVPFCVESALSGAAGLVAW